MGENCQDYESYREVCEAYNIDPATLRKEKKRTYNGNFVVKIDDLDFVIERVELSLANNTISCSIWENADFGVLEWLKKLNKRHLGSTVVEKLILTARDEFDKPFVKYQAVSLGLKEHTVSLSTKDSVTNFISPVTHAVVFTYGVLDRVP